MGNEQLPENKIRMLYCDLKGNVRSTIIENSIYELAKSYANQLERAHKHYATISLEIAPGSSVPWAVEIKPEHVWALERILEHAIKRGEIPTILKKYPKEIIRMGRLQCEESSRRNERVATSDFPAKTPEVLQRLAYYSEDRIEAAIPIYKAQYRYPLIILKRLMPNEKITPEVQRLLALDGDGDLAIIRLPSEAVDEAERNLDIWRKINNSEGCLIYSRHQDSYAIGHLEISALQRKALDLMAQHFEETGYGQQPIPTDAQAVLAKAKECSL
jgi:hypothetical protein